MNVGTCIILAAAWTTSRWSDIKKFIEVPKNFGRYFKQSASSNLKKTCTNMNQLVDKCLLCFSSKKWQFKTEYYLRNSYNEKLEWASKTTDSHASAMCTSLKLGWKSYNALKREAFVFRILN